MRKTVAILGLVTAGLLAATGCDLTDKDVVVGSVGPLFVGGWADVTVQVSSTSALTFEDLSFTVEGAAGAAPEGGSISLSQPAGPYGLEDTEPGQFTLLGGYEPGSYEVVVRDPAGVEVASVPFELSEQWTDSDMGPPVWVQGPDHTRFASGVYGAASGSDGLGLDSFSGFSEQTGTRSVLMILADFRDTRFSTDPSDVDELRTSWMNALIDGESDSAGRVRSVADYFEEVSGGRLEIEGGVFGPVSLDVDMHEVYLDTGWQTGTQQIITAALAIDDDGDGIPDIDQIDSDGDGTPDIGLVTADSIVFVTPTLDLGPAPACTPTSDPTEVCDGIDNDCDGQIDTRDSDLEGPCATNPTCGDGVVDQDVPDGDDTIDEVCDDGNDFAWDRCNNKCEVRTQHSTWPTASGATYAIRQLGPIRANRRYAIVKMPAFWEALDGRQVSETLAHEIAHNLGLPDLYAVNGTEVRTMGNWDLMHGDGRFGQLSLSQRASLGWVDTEEFYTFNPRTDGSAIVRMSPLEVLDDGQVPHEAGAEIRVAPGWNFYVQYRLGQFAQVGDQESPHRQQASTTEGWVMVTERRAGGADLMMPQRAVSMAPVGNGKVTVPLDTSSGVYRLDDVGGGMDMQLEVISADDASAVVDVTYANFAADPSIQPWPRPGARYQSPDIEVVNDKNRAGAPNAAAWKNVPWAGHPNDIVATVRNEGNDAATGVMVRFAYKRFNAGRETTVLPLGDVMVDIPAFSTRQVTYEGWTPPSEDHYCVTAEILPFAGELSAENNLAQSNYTKYWSASASPAARVVHDVVVRNPYDQEGVAFLRVKSDSDEFRTYVSARWVRLAAGAETTVQVAHEYALDDFSDLYEELQGDYVPSNRVEVDAWMFDPARPLEAERTEEVLGGVTMDVIGGIGTDIVTQQTFEEGSIDLSLSGQVVRRDDGTGVGEGSVWVSVWELGVDEPVSTPVAVGSDGSFTWSGTATTGVERVQLEYAGFHPFAPSRWISER